MTYATCGLIRRKLNRNKEPHEMPILVHISRNGLTMPLSRFSVGTYQETSSHATSQGTISLSRLSSLSHCDPGIKSGISVRELIST